MGGRPLLFACLFVAAAGAARADEPRSNVFGDPFLQVTHALPGCPPAAPPLLTRTEANEQAHGRAQRGVSCYLAGRCRLANSYLYDQEIVPRVETAIHADGRFDNTTTVWVLGQRRWVWLKGCVANEALSHQLETLVRGIDDVEAVVNELMVGTAGQPPYDRLPK